ncbi:TIGR02611 family protein [Subtercola boreus]|uniref:TIGR02611 family protein n=1 Tax=Subtercola boreus TaxID=120213 RepID=A0A3E0WDT1_9MICO|nr:TIGR02611 family protein [Subtercola boreus]RFA23378.1 TIGR02611 family protein [Subtercola boreus]RFA23771.1 TIGR02611 family protein [Subtercola boreus]RFA29472.1 TIGR02611 family protein [Subtercola boreus]
MTTAWQRSIDEGSSARHPFRLWLARRRAFIELHPRLRLSYLVAVAAVGITIVLVGIVLIPLPGPGWLIVFLGFAVLGTEFAAARRVNAFLRRMLGRASAWWRRRREQRKARTA